MLDCPPGARHHAPCTVYYCGLDGRRYAFPNRLTFLSWYEEGEPVRTVDEATLASIPLAGNVTYRPGRRLLKIQTDPKVYAVSKGGVLRWLPDEATAAAIYGDDWATRVDDVPDTFFADYVMGEPLPSVTDTGA